MKRKTALDQIRNQTEPYDLIIVGGRGHRPWRRGGCGRTRALLLDAKASVEVAPTVASLLARELGRDDDWEQQQVEAYRLLAKGCIFSEPESLFRR